VHDRPDKVVTALPEIWRPGAERIAASQLTRFASLATARFGAPDLPTDPSRAWQLLHEWSVREAPSFWSAMWTFSATIGDRGDSVLTHGEQMPGARWFEDSQINYTENLLAGDADGIAIIARDESGVRRTLTRGDLRRQVAAIAAAFAALGIGAGDVVAGHLANTPEAVIAMLATAHLGATWTSTSPDFGATGVIERIGQTGAKLLIACAQTTYGGKQHDCTETAARIKSEISSIQTLVLVGHLRHHDQRRLA
jgi:acetoacetyl-CoA synthetase